MSRWLTTPRAYWTLAALVLVFRIATAWPITRAGYMDASYTLHIGEQLARGRGFNEELLWNYLDEPRGLPHPSNLYWLPLPALLAAASFLIFGVSYHAAQLPFVVLSLFPPLFAFYLARRVYGRDEYAWSAALLTTFSGFYTIYWVAPDNFTPFAVAADLALLWMAFGLTARRARDFLIAGIFVGLSQLARADGFLLLGVAPLVLLCAKRGWREPVTATAATALGFLLVMAPWFARNYSAVGTGFAPGGTHTLFLTSYDELFRYNVADLTLARYLAWGMPNILMSKLTAFGYDLLILLLGALQIFLAPFAVIGLWRGRGRAEFRTMLIYLALLWGTMTFVFTFPGIRGSMLHSAAALVPYFAVALPPGLAGAIAWVARRRKSWEARGAERFFSWGLVALALVVSVFLYAQGVFANVLGGSPTIPLWNERDAEYAAVGRELDARGVPKMQPIMTVDPPSFYNDTGRHAIVIPTESVEAIWQAARAFDAHYLVLQYDHPRPLNSLYAGQNEAGLAPVARFQDALGRPVTLLEIQR